jgi:hypothetical protein
MSVIKRDDRLPLIVVYNDAPYQRLSPPPSERTIARGVVVVDAATHREAVSLLATFVDDEPCSLDHHGHCQAHDWFAEGECNVARARRLIGGQ